MNSVINNMLENKYFIYTIGAIQGIYQDPEKNNVLINWREEIKQWVEKEKLPFVILDPLVMEKLKTGHDAKVMHEKLEGWKRSGHWELYDGCGLKIWYGTPECWGDYTCVVNSDFIIGYGDNDYISPGTHKELGVAEFLRRPVYWVTKDNISDMKDSTLWGVRLSGGKVFPNFNQLKQFLLEKYNLKIK